MTFNSITITTPTTSKQSTPDCSYTGAFVRFTEYSFCLISEQTSQIGPTDGEIVTVNPTDKFTLMQSFSISVIKSSSCPVTLAAYDTLVADGTTLSLAPVLFYNPTGMHSGVLPAVTLSAPAVVVQVCHIP